jgi:hypothetical protein
MVYQDPLAYLLGIEGVALLDAWAGDHDRAFTDARLSEIRRLLDDEKLRDRGVQVERVSTVTAYEQWSAGYDAEAAGGLFAADEPVVAGFLASREPGVGWTPPAGPGGSPSSCPSAGTAEWAACQFRIGPGGRAGLAWSAPHHRRPHPAPHHTPPLLSIVLAARPRRSARAKRRLRRALSPLSWPFHQYS